ncbi:MAG: tRNA (N(6)-L-threonylcarbamoyladenosine(37)-C(2))-methylthiotransferase MtaB [Spirochaetota bacterium]|nr:tRNA (N(6)-L-threonylcarbamoyladenosine(37)-C(2))-methylthiotransferase MtaB [Spirochaetota bacterium]
MRVAFYTLGCKLNQSESEALASSFKSRGFFVRRHDEDADIFIVNTCTVTSKAEQKARRIIRHLARRNPQSAVIVTGCYAQLDAPVLRELAPNVVVLGHDRKYQLLGLAECVEAELAGGPFGSPGSAGSTAIAAAVRGCIDRFLGEKADSHGIFRFDADTYSFHSRAFLKIQDGCDHQCAYCRVRMARGASVSLAPGEVIARAEHLTRSGYRELVLTGVNVTAYHDPADRRFRLPQLIRRLLDQPGPIASCRIRLSSLEPEMIGDDLLEAVADPRICAHFHIPVQSGSDRILKAVYRPYTADRVRAVVEGLRRAKDDPFLAADVIVGLPGETDDDFEATRSLIEELGFATLHIFPFSPRPGTELYRARHRVPERIAGERAAVLRDLAGRLHDEYAVRWVGREVEVLPEEPVVIEGKKFWSSISGNYLRVDLPFEEVSRRTGGQTESSGAADAQAGRQGVRGSLLPAVIERMDGGLLFGSLI